MKRERYLHICAVFLSATFLLAALAGCGGNGGNPSGTDTRPYLIPGTGKPLRRRGDTVTVGSVEELLEAIAPIRGSC